ncbi:MAG: DNA polymerase III subunit delta [Clostridia bacterium]|nr:DNA polymerase III subunit delta [Clostridia bacterium]
MKTLKTRLSKQIQNCYLIQGEDSLLYDKSLSMIKRACNLEMPDFNFTAFDDDSFSSFQTIIDACETMPFASEYKIVLLKNLSKINENDKKLLKKYIENSLSSSVLVIFDNKNLFDFLKPSVEFVDAKRLDKNTLTSLIASDLKKYGKQISLTVASDLIESCNGYYTLIANEIFKLASYTDEVMITKKMVEEIVIKEPEFKVFELTEALGKKNGDLALNLLSYMEKDTSTFSLIANHFRRLFFISISDLSDTELAKQLGVKEYAITKSRLAIKNFSKVQLKKILSLCEEVDFSIKKGLMQQQNAIYYLVFNILNI